MPMALSTTTTWPATSGSRAGSQFRARGDSPRWALKRNCSMSPAALGAIFAMLAGVSVGIALLFWWFGATLVLPFAVIEVTAVGAALLMYARHAGDGDWLWIDAGHLHVERHDGCVVQRIEFDLRRLRLRRDADGLIGLATGSQVIKIGHHATRPCRDRVARELAATLVAVRT